MGNKKYLTEENYEKGKKKLKTVALIILILGIIIGGILIATGFVKQGKVNSNYSEENKATITAQLETEKQNLLQKKNDLETKIKPVEDQIKKLQREPFTGFNDAYYERQDKIEELQESIATDTSAINVINNALDENFGHCKFDNVKNNTYTSKYCSLKLQLEDFTDFNKDFDSFGSIPFFMFGGIIILVSCMIAGIIYMITKRREIIAFSAQQVMPVAKEGIDEMAPTIGNAVGTIGKELTKGIKEGLKDDDEK